MFERRFKSENYTGTGGRCGEKRFERKTKHEAYGGCVSCSLLTASTGENKEEETKKLMELEFAVRNVRESCKKKLKQGMKVQFSLGREPTTRKYVVVDIAPIEGGGVEEKKTKKKEGDDKIRRPR